MAHAQAVGQVLEFVAWYLDHPRDFLPTRVMLHHSPLGTLRIDTSQGDPRELTSSVG